MKARLLLVALPGRRPGYELLCFDGTKKQLAQKDLISFFNNFRDDEYLSHGEDGHWDGDAMDMTDIEGETVAYVVDTPREPGRQQLVIIDPTPFVEAFQPEPDAPVEMIPITEYAAMYGVSREIIKVYCREGRLLGATKVGTNWVVPRDAIYPTDQRRRIVNRQVKEPVTPQPEK